MDTLTTADLFWRYVPNKTKNDEPHLQALNAEIAIFNQAMTNKYLAKFEFFFYDFSKIGVFFSLVVFF